MIFNKAFKIFWKEIKEQKDIKINEYQLGVIVERAYKYAIEWHESEQQKEIEIKDLSIADLTVVIENMKSFIDGFEDKNGNIDESDPYYIKHMDTLEKVYERHDFMMKKIKDKFNK